MRIPLLLAALTFSAAAAQAAGLTVPVDQSRVVPFQGAAANVVVGNTDIADVRVIDSRTLVVVGKRPGMTNIMVLDQAGRTLFSEQVLVSANAGSAVTVYRGAFSEEMACSPYCRGPGGAAAPAPSAPPAAAP